MGVYLASCSRKAEMLLEGILVVILEGFGSRWILSWTRTWFFSNQYLFFFWIKCPNFHFGEIKTHGRKQLYSLRDFIITIFFQLLFGPLLFYYQFPFIVHIMLLPFFSFLFPVFLFRSGGRSLISNKSTMIL